jgi:hypothetical protein
MTATDSRKFNVAVVLQAGRLQYLALLFLASLRHASEGFPGRIFLAEPEQGPLWPKDPRVKDHAVRVELERLGGEFLTFPCRHFGAAYPPGNKIELLAALPEGEPFVFFDTDTLVTGRLQDVPFDFDRPSASLRREGTWPEPELYGPDRATIWRSLYDRFGLDFDASLDRAQPQGHWRRYLYFNAGAFWYRCPRVFGDHFTRIACAIRNDPPAELLGQSLDPWLDQVALPLVIHHLGGGKDALPPGFIDGATTCHYRNFPLLYARETDRVIEVLETVAAPNRLKKLLKRHEPIRRLVYQGRGAKVRALFDQAHLPRREQAIRSRIKAEGHWIV